MVVNTKYTPLNYIFEGSAVNIGIYSVFLYARLLKDRAAYYYIYFLHTEHFIHFCIKPSFNVIIKQDFKMLFAFTYISGMEYYISRMPKFFLQIVYCRFEGIYLFNRYQNTTKCKYRKIAVECSKVMVATLVDI